MPSDLRSDIDVYRDWLQLEVTQRPAHAYEMLGLKPLESDSTRIRGAIGRQRALLERREADADPELYQQISQELEAAIATLLEPDRKQLLDAQIKRRTRASANATGAPRTAVGGETITCRQCSKVNAGNRRFCCECGSSLFDVCPTCSVELVATERFCGACGTNVVEVRRKQEAEFENRLKEAQQLQKEHRFEEASAVLHGVALIEDARFDRFAELAVELLQGFAEQRKELEQQVQRRFERASRYMQSFRYEKAFETLSAIPERLRNTAVKELFGAARARRDEVLRLSGDIRVTLAEKRWNELLPMVEQLLVLQPDHAKGRELAEQLRDRICQQAKQKLLENAYDEARMLLDTIPEFARNEESAKLLDRAHELDCLAQEIKLSPLADGVLQGIAERLTKLSPNDPKLVKQLNEIKARRATKPADPHWPHPIWSPWPKRPKAGVTIDLFSYFTRCGYASPEVETAVREHPGRFAVALGLALQAKNQAAIAVNLLPPEKSSGLLGGLSLSFRKPAPKGGWGLDLGPTGLRAIRLGPEVKEGRVTIDVACFLPHSKPLSQAGDEIAQSEIVAATLKAFREKYPFPKEKEKRETVVVALPGVKALGRFFDLPPVAAKKLPDLVQYEAKHQVPVPLEELNWCYKILDEAEGKSADEQPRHTMLLAAKEFQVRERLSAFTTAEIPVDVLTADPIALHNAVVYEYLADETDDRSLALLDIGAKSANFVVSSKKSIWFRNCGDLGDDFTAKLVETFQLTYALAEELKRAPHRAKRYHQLHAALTPLFVQVASEVERSLSSFGKHFSAREVARLLLTGGAAQTHGLLRYLIHGK